MTIRLIVTGVLILAMLISYMALKVVRKKHESDPEYERKQYERAAEYRRKMQEEKDLENMFSASDYNCEKDDDE